MTDFGEMLSKVASEGRAQAFNIRAYMSLDNCYVVELISNIRAEDDFARRSRVEQYFSVSSEFTRFPIVVLLRYKDS